jgi:peptidoglycan/LPS O-acetylase OafA/YrhL
MLFPDGLRAIAAMIVILPHCAGFFSYWVAPSAPTRVMIVVAKFGVYGVQIFFVLSGFVIAYTLRDQGMSARYIGKFILRRSIRLDPPYWAAIALLMGYLALRQHLGHDPMPYPSRAQLIAHVFYMQDILGYGDINVVFWTLCIEIQFYIIFCLLIWLVQILSATSPHLRHLAFLALFTFSLAWPANLLHGGLFPGSFLPHWYGFLAGAMAWWSVDRRLPRWAGCIALSSLWLVVAARFELRSLAVALTATSLLAASYRGNLYHWLNLFVFQLLGKLSYCIYLVRVPIADLMLSGLKRMAPAHEAISYVFFLAVIFITVAVAYGMHRLVEVPALRWSKLVKPGKGPTVGAATLVAGLSVPDDSTDPEQSWRPTGSVT